MEADYRIQIAIRALAGTLLAATALCVGGCQHADVADAAMAMRAEKPGRTLGIYIAGEEARPPKLARTFDLMERRVETDAERTQAMPEKVGALLDRDVRRFETRGPEYSEWIEASLGGHPEKIELTAIVLFY